MVLKFRDSNSHLFCLFTTVPLYVALNFPQNCPLKGLAPVFGVDPSLV